MPCAEIFVEQEASYREAVLPANIRARVAVEAAHVRSEEHTSELQSPD